MSVGADLDAEQNSRAAMHALCEQGARARITRRNSQNPNLRQFLLCGFHCMLRDIQLVRLSMLEFVLSNFI